jgi:hypothetical protein
VVGHPRGDGEQRIDLGRRGRRPESLSPSNACGDVTSWTN